MKHSILIGILLLFTSCTTHKTISALSIETELEDTDILSVRVEAIDNDGIQDIKISFPELAITETYSPKGKKKWEYEWEVTIDQEHDDLGFIIVHLIDAKGEEKVKKVNLSKSTKITSL